MKIFNSLLLLFAISITLFSGCKDDDPKPFKPMVELQISHEWNDSNLNLNKSYYWNHDSRIDTIIPTTLIYHINHLSLHTQDSIKIHADQTYYMIDYGDKKVLPSNISFTAPKEGVKYYITSLEFTLGVSDSLSNSSGSLNSLFIAPMYWGMIQGYINFKFEALSPQAPNSALIYHIGGYTKPYINSRKVRVVFDKPYYLNQENTLTISANLLKLFNSVNQIDIKTNDLIHSPSDNSVLIADNMAKLFGFKSFK